MESNTIYVVIGIVIGLVIIALSIVFLIVLRNKVNKNVNTLDKTEILTLFNKENIVNVEYIRNKIVISFKDITLFNIEELHSLGISGINVVGEKIKFYIEGPNQVNEDLYNSIKVFVEGD